MGETKPNQGLDNQCNWNSLAAQHSILD